MTDLRSRLCNRWIGTIALVWIAVLVGTWTLIYGDVQLPRLAAVVHIVKEFALLACMLGAAYGWGRLALIPWHTRPGEQPNPFWAFGLGFGVLWMATFVVAALHWLGPAWPWLLMTGGWLALIGTARPLPQLHLRPWSSWTATQWFLLIVMAFSVGYSLVVWALVPPLAWDEVSYHLPIPRMFIKAGGFVNIPTIVHSNWPSGMEMLNTLGLLMGSDILPHLIVTAMVVLTALGLASFARRWFDQDTAWLAATLYLAMPMVKYLAGVALIEGALGLFGFLAIWAGYAWLERGAWRDLVVAGVLGGLAANIKLTGAAVLLAVGVTGLVWLVLRGRDELGHSIMQVAAYALIAVGVAAPWYIRSVVNTGNPVWPFLYDIFGGRDWDAIGAEIHTAWLHRPNLAPTVWNYIGGPWYLTVQWRQFGGLSMGGAIMGLAPLSALFCHHKRRLLGYLIAVTMMIYTIWFLTTHQTRFLMGIVPALVLLAAYAFTQLLKSWPAWLAALGRVAFLFYLVMGLPFVNANQRTLIADRWPYVAGYVSREEFLTNHVNGYPAFQFANQHLPPDAKVLLATWETRGYYLDRPSVWANPISQRVIKWEQFDDAKALMDSLHSLGITHVFWNDQLVIEDVANEEHTDKLLRTLLADCGRPIYTRRAFTIYELQTTH